jgi:hypothetical protein
VVDINQERGEELDSARRSKDVDTAEDIRRTQWEDKHGPDPVKCRHCSVGVAWEDGAKEADPRGDGLCANCADLVEAQENWPEIDTLMRALRRATNIGGDIADALAKFPETRAQERARVERDARQTRLWIALEEAHSPGQFNAKQWARRVTGEIFD